MAEAQHTTKQKEAPAVRVFDPLPMLVAEHERLVDLYNVMDAATDGISDEMRAVERRRERVEQGALGFLATSREGALFHLAIAATRMDDLTDDPGRLTTDQREKKMHDVQIAVVSALRFFGGLGGRIDTFMWPERMDAKVLGEEA